MTERQFCFTNKIISKSSNCFIVAEVGQNHQGDINVAKRLIAVSKLCGADCVKFQKTCLQEKFTRNALNKEYFNKHSWGNTYGEHKRHLEFTEQQFIELQNFANKVGILFTASAMDCVSLDFLHSINMPFMKIGSGDSNNLLLIENAARKQTPLVISTGMANINTVERIYKTVSQYHKNFALLHCVSSYPTPYEDINLNVINLYIEKFRDIVIGYSGHELGIDVCLAAVSMGAKIIEKHITLNKDLKGTDHSCSLEPEEFKIMVDRIRKLEIALGCSEKRLYSSEIDCYEKLGKSLVFATSLPKKHELCKDDIKIKVAIPKGIDGALLDSVIGRKIKKDVDSDESIFYELLE